LNPEDALAVVLTKLDECGISYMITGSFASNIHGVPRATQDADVIIEADKKSLTTLMETFGEDFYASGEAAQQALQTQGFFNVVHLPTGFKIDLIIKKSRSFSQVEFSRRERGNFSGQDRWFAAAEDVILAKLEWAKMGSSERQYQDALNVAKIQKKRLDRRYLEKWARDLTVGSLLEKMFQEMGV
jgi:hypothetical protein